MTKQRNLFALLLALAAVAHAQADSFASRVYPVLEKAGCRDCHTADGVASPTRLRFPDPDSPGTRIEAFGKSLVEFVDRQNPGSSLLLLKPTSRVAHTGGERIAKGSAEETVLRQWVTTLATLRGAELSSALRYRQEKAAGHGPAPAAVLRRLTHSQYNRTVRDLLRDSTSPANQFPPEDFVNGFKNQYQALSISPLLAEAYASAAERLASNAFRRGDSKGILPCKPRAESDADCEVRFITTFGRNAFRRPLDAAEIARYRAIFKSETVFLKGAQAVIETMLQSPNFLFRLDDTPNPKLKAYAAAAGLSYFFWDSTPDAALLDSAANGELDTSEGIKKAARRLVDHPKAREGVDEFVSQWLRFDRVMTASRERRLFPLFSRELATSMTEEARRFVGDLVWNDGNFMTAFTANHSFLNSDLAAVYKVTPPARDFDRVEFPPESERAGLLGQTLFLTLTSKPDDTAPTSRGLFVREQFLCQQVPPPPPGVDTNLPPVDEGKPVNNRDRLAGHASQKACASCHSLIDPIGFGLEKFDAIGMRREQHKLVFYPAVHGAAARRAKPKEILLDIDTNGFLAGVKDSDFNNPRQLGAVLAKTPECQECIVKQVFRYMSGRPETPADQPLLTTALTDFRNSQFRFKNLMISLVAGARQMSNVITKRTRLSRRIFLQGMSLAQAPVVVGLPPLISMFNANGTAFAAPAAKNAPVDPRFVLWFNGNGIPERYWIPNRVGTDYDLTPCLTPLARHRDDVLVLSGLDNAAVGGLGGDGHPSSMSALMTCTRYTGRGPGGPSVDQHLAAKLGDNMRFRSLQLGVSQESFGGSMHRNMSWAGPNRPLPPEEIPHRLFDRLFGARDEGWVNRKRSILDAVRQDAAGLRKGLPKEDEQRLDEHLSSVRDLERAIASLPPEFRKVAAPEEDFDLKDWPRIARIQSDLLAYALATNQTRVASYMLTKCQGLARFPWLGHTAARHHDYTHKDGKAPGERGPEGQRILRDICRWHVEEFAYLVGKLKSIPEGAGTVLDNTVLTFVHEHAEAGPHKNNGMIALVAGSKSKLALGRHAHLTGTIGDLYLTLADNALGANFGKFPTASRKLTEILA